MTLSLKIVDIHANMIGCSKAIPAEESAILHDITKHVIVTKPVNTWIGKPLLLVVILLVQRRFW